MMKKSLNCQLAADASTIVACSKYTEHLPRPRNQRSRLGRFALLVCLILCLNVGAFGNSGVQNAGAAAAPILRDVLPALNVPAAQDSTSGDEMADLVVA